MKQNLRNVPEEELFCQYSNIIKLEENEKIKICCPLQSNQSHKFAYVLFSNGSPKPSRLVVIPYLHERRIYLNRLKMNTKYFYTTIEPEEKGAEEEKGISESIVDSQVIDVD